MKKILYLSLFSLLLIGCKEKNVEVDKDYVANDRVGVQLWKFENHMIDSETFTNNLHRMQGITFQYFFGTERAIQLLKKL